MGRKAAFFSDFSSIDFGFELEASAPLPASGLFMHTFTESDMRRFVRKSGLATYLKKKQFYPFDIRIGKDVNDIHKLSVIDSNLGRELIDFRVSEKRLIVPHFSKEGNSVHTVAVEWLSTYNPRRTEFTSRRKQLPGQEHPSLGCLSELMKIMYYLSKKVKKDAFMDIPDHLHLALMYAPLFHFIDPATEAMVLAVKHDLRDISFADIAWGGVTGAIINTATGQPLSYTPADQLYPISRNMRAFFASPHYTHAVKEQRDLIKGAYRLDRKILAENKKELLKRYAVSEV